MDAIKAITQLLVTLVNPSCRLCKQPVFQFRQSICGDCLPELDMNYSRCSDCAIPLPHANARCAACQSQAFHFDHVIALAPYQTPLSQLIQQLKYQKDVSCGNSLAKLWWQQNQTQIQKAPPQQIFYVPISKRSWRKRGFNQAELLARQWSRYAGIPICHQGLRRVDTSQQHVELNKQQRWQQVKREYHWKDNANKLKVASHIALVDDVLTTGATASYLANLLKQAGAQHVDIWCLARTP